MQRTPLIPRPVQPRLLKDKMFLALCMTSAVLTILLVVVLLASIAHAGGGRLSWEFLTGDNSQNPEMATITTGLMGSVMVLSICALVAMPVGVGTAILLEEYRPRNRYLQWGHQFIQTNITNLAGVPSIVYGILGASLFASMDFFPIQGTMNDPSFSVGSEWRYQYEDVAENKYFTMGEKDGQLPVLEPGTSFVFFQDMHLSEPAEVQVIERSELKPIEDRIASDLEAIEDQIRDGLDDARTSRRGPVAMDDAKAQAIVDAAFAETNLKADTEQLKAIAKKQLLGMDGMESRELRSARRDLVGELTQAEMAASGVEGKILAGTQAQRQEDRSWYYVQFPFGRSILAGGLTLMLVILPIIIVASQESIRSVSQSMRHGCLALGSTKWQSIRSVVLPSAIPGICTGAILAMSRAIGEAAPLLLLAAAFVTYTPSNLMDGFTVMPMQIFGWTGQPQEAFQATAAAGIIVLLAVLLSFNALAVYIRQATQRGR